jgi:protein gp37
MAGGDPAEVEKAKTAFRSAGIGYALVQSIVQVGGHPKAGGRELDGRMWDQYPGTTTAG